MGQCGEITQLHVIRTVCGKRAVTCAIQKGSANCFRAFFSTCVAKTGPVTEIEGRAGFFSDASGLRWRTTKICNLPSRVSWRVCQTRSVTKDIERGGLRQWRRFDPACSLATMMMLDVAARFVVV